MWPPVFLLTFSRAQGDSLVHSLIRPPGAPSTLVRRAEKQRPVLMDIMERKRNRLMVNAPPQPIGQTAHHCISTDREGDDGA